MRSSVVFKTNTPVITATADREAVTTGGQNDVYTTLLTTRGRLRKKSGARGLDFGLIENKESYELLCRFQVSLNAGLKVNGKVFVDLVEYTIQSWEVIDQIKHLYKFDLACQNLSGSVVNLGGELITNGGFTGNANGWILDAMPIPGWQYDTNKVTFQLGSSVAEARQLGALTNGSHYRVIFTISGTVGFVIVTLGSGDSQAFQYNAGTVSFDGVWATNVNKIRFTPSVDFGGGSITNVSVKQIL